MSDDLKQYETLDEVAADARKSGERLRTFFGHDGVAFPDDDGERDLLEGEEDARFLRCNGEAICAICQKPYWKHPDEMRVLGWEDRPFLKRLCDGTLAKL